MILRQWLMQASLLHNEITDFPKCDLGVRCENYKDEDAYLNGILKFVRKIKYDPEDYLDYWNLWNELDLRVFVKGLKELEKHILKTIDTQFDQRGDVPVY